ncbi:MAG: dihydrofolate reductase [Hyphomonadaceae bacterium]
MAARGRRGEIGRDGGLLFRLKGDMAHFRAATRGRPVVMGRKTWDSLPKKPLPKRPNIVLTRNTDFFAPEAFVAPSLSVALQTGRAMAALSGAGEVCVIGGAEIYAAALPFADRILLTEVDAEAEADVFFPALDAAMWREASAVRTEADADNEAAFTVRDLRRAA